MPGFGLEETALINWRWGAAVYRRNAPVNRWTECHAVFYRRLSIVKSDQDRFHGQLRYPGDRHGVKIVKERCRERTEVFPA